MDKKKSLGINAVLSNFVDSINKTIGMISTEFKEYQNMLSEEELNAENRKIRNIRENGFISGHSSMVNSIEDLKGILTNMNDTIVAQNNKITELEEKVAKLSKPTIPGTDSGTSSGGNN